MHDFHGDLMQRLCRNGVAFGRRSQAFRRPLCVPENAWRVAADVLLSGSIEDNGTSVETPRKQTTGGNRTPVVGQAGGKAASGTRGG
jgi:hypothetical protein